MDKGRGTLASFLKPDSPSRPRRYGPAPAISWSDLAIPSPGAALAMARDVLIAASNHLKPGGAVILIAHMAKQGVTVMASSNRTVAEEMPDAYKNVDVVVDAVEEASLAGKVARLVPHLVIKG